MSETFRWLCANCDTPGCGPSIPQACPTCGATENAVSLEEIESPNAGNVRACRVCGCTEGNACVDDRTRQPCHWVARDLCSACVGLERLIEQQTIAKGLSLGDALQEWQEMNGAPVGQDLEPFAVFMFSRGFDACQSLAEALAMVAAGEIDQVTDTEIDSVPNRLF